MPEIAPAVESFARIKVVGVGGGGGKALDRMVEAGVKDVDFVAINADAQALHNSKATTKVHIGKQTTKGLGAGADPEVGKSSAEESREDIKKALEGADMLFVVATMGGGTGTGAGPIVAEIANELEILTVGFATRPFTFEGEKRRRNAEMGINDLRDNVDTLITIPNDRILQTVDRKTPLLEAFGVVDDVLRQGVAGISDLITIDGLINLDFADVKSIMEGAGSALMGIGSARGDDRAIRAAKEAIESPLLEVSIDGARGVLFNVTGGEDMAMHEVNEAAEVITAAVDPDANIIFGANIDSELEGELRITVIATGFDTAYSLGYRPRNEATETITSEPLAEEDAPKPEAGSTVVPDSKVTDQDVDLAKTEAKTEDIWTFNAEEEERETPAFLRRGRRKKTHKSNKKK